MDKIVMSRLDEEIYHERLDDGLNVYIYKKEGFIKKGAYFVTNYGSATNDFKPIGEDEIVSFPKGIAHFLEHKLFESDDNENVFDKFKKYGADVNAYTNHFVTNYYFSTTDNFDECLTELINFVQSPHFTDENVLKEKGIINQEINMTDDSASRFMFEKAFDMALIKNPNKYKTIGDKPNVDKITKEDLYRCYNTFYHPSNMVLVIYGDVDLEKTINLVKENQAKREFDCLEKIEIREFKEDAKVNEKYAEFKKNVSIPKVCLCYKFIIPFIKGEEKFKKTLFLDLLLDMKFGATTSFEKDLIKNDVIKTELSWTYSIFDDVILFFIESDVSNKDEFIKQIDERLRTDDFNEEIFELNKRAILTSMVKAFENPSSIGSIIFNNVIKYGDIINNAYDIYANYAYQEFTQEFKKLNFDNKSVIYVTSKED